MFIIPAQLESYRSLKDRTLKVSFETAELTPQQMANLQGALMKAGYLAFNPDPFTEDKIREMESIKADYDDPGKTPSKRMRNVLYVYWKQDNRGYEVFNDFYIHYMEKFINHIKEKLDERL